MQALTWDLSGKQRLRPALILRMRRACWTSVTAESVLQRGEAHGGQVDTLRIHCVMGATIKTARRDCARTLACLPTGWHAQAAIKAMEQATTSAQDARIA